jgi:hypothetical protein
MDPKESSNLFTLQKVSSYRTANVQRFQERMKLLGLFLNTGNAKISNNVIDLK